MCGSNWAAIERENSTWGRLPANTAGRPRRAIDALQSFMLTAARVNTPACPIQVAVAAALAHCTVLERTTGGGRGRGGGEWKDEVTLTYS